jgi:hypothetical protein
MANKLDRYRSYKQGTRKDPDTNTPSEDKAGFAEIRSPSHSLQLLNKYVRTDLIILVHGCYHEQKKQSDDKSPLELLRNAILIALDMCENKPDICDKLKPSKLHIKHGFALSPQEDYEHDVKLLKYHAYRHHQVLESFNEEDDRG